MTRTAEDVRDDADSWATKLLGDESALQFVVLRYDRERSGGKRYKQDLNDADSQLLAACKAGNALEASKIISSLRHYDDSGFAFADTVAALADCLVPRLQRRQVCYDLADWGTGGAMLTLWSEHSK
ncbi:hypothetical protein [Rhodopirellula baltica]